MSFFHCALAGVAAPQGTFYLAECRFSAHCAAPCPVLFPDCVLWQGSPPASHCARASSLGDTDVFLDCPSGHSFVVANLVPLYGERTATVDTGKLLQLACQVGSIVPRALAFTPHMDFCEIRQRDLRSTCLTGLCFVCLWNTISSDILATAAFEQQIPCLLFHIYTTLKIFNDTQNSIIHTTTVLDKSAIRSRPISFFRLSSSNRATRSDN